MCTVTILPAPPDDDRAYFTTQAVPQSHAITGLRLMTNRDELHARPAALPPSRHRCGALEAIYPVDPAGGGTWVGVNEAGVIVTLLNLTPRIDVLTQKQATVSRGDVVPRALQHASADQAAASITDAHVAQMKPFRAVCVDGQGIIVVRWDGKTLSHEPQGPPEHAMCFTSSGLGDHVVELPRRQLFDSLITPRIPKDAWRVQTQFHLHRWRKQPELSVNMHRADARTVSCTVVTLDAQSAVLSYQPGDETGLHSLDANALKSQGDATTLTLDLNTNAFADDA